ncbi:MAG: hypothetical protein HY393_00875 [Candidatus Diapherotrites archaeon]|nr:hypothetical protein [Candidatus Diapherotrites archaeon]
MGYSTKAKNGKTYYLHQKGKLFFFSSNPLNSIELPAGYEVIEGVKTGLPLLKRKTQY